MALLLRMKKINVYPVVIVITVILFITPFFWLKPGFMNIGGDGGRLYFLDPSAVLQNTWNMPGSYVYSYANIGYLFFQVLLTKILGIPTSRISFEHGLQLGFGFLGVFLVVNELLRNTEQIVNRQRRHLIGIVSGITYVVLITKIGWPVALVTQNQVFLNPIIFYLLLRYCLSKKFSSILAGLILTVIFSANFGFTSAPQLLSFFPLSFIFLYFSMTYVMHRKMPWRGLFAGAGLFLGLHAFHLVPVIVSLLTKGSAIHAQVFDQTKFGVSGPDYFSVNRAELGHMSVELFQPWLSQNFLGLILPIVALSGFLVRKSKLLSLVGIFFAVTLFLVSANVTQIGVDLYQKLFYIPGFVMFRSFSEKWYFVYAFYYALLVALSLFALLEKRNIRLAVVICTTLFGISAFRIVPFLSGKAIQTTVDQSRNVSTIFSIDPDLLDVLAFIRRLPQDGKVLTLPLTYTYLQIAYGKEGGAYVGISMVPPIAGRQDFAGLWSLEPYRQSILGALREKDFGTLIELLSYLNIRYVLYNSDQRPMGNLPRYFDPEFSDAESEIPSLIRDQSGYGTLLGALPAKKIFQKGYYSVYELENRVVRPLMYLPDDPVGRSSVSYVKRSPVLYDIEVSLKGRKSPFLLVFSQYYYSAWDLSLAGVSKRAVKSHSIANNYANGWIIDPAQTDGQEVLRGHIYLTSQNVFYAGSSISGVTVLVILFLVLRDVLRRKREAN